MVSIKQYMLFLVLALLACTASFATGAVQLAGTWVLDAEATERHLIANPINDLEKAVGWTLGLSCGLVVTFEDDWADVTAYGQPPSPQLRRKRVEEMKQVYEGQLQLGRPITLYVASVGANLLIDIDRKASPMLWKRANPKVSERRSVAPMDACLEPLERVYQHYKAK